MNDIIKQNHKKAFMESAKAFAKLSKCERLKVGCVAVKHGSIIGIGWNGLPSNVDDDSCEYVDEITYELITKSLCRHAERNLLIHLSKCTESAHGATLFVTHSPCLDCSHMIKDAGFTRLIYEQCYRDMSGVDMLEKYGIEVEKL